MKAIMKNIKPIVCANIMNLVQSILIIKDKREATAIQKLINENGYVDIYVHCSMAKHIKDYLQMKNGKYVCNVPKDYESELNGKVVFKFRCYNVEDIFWEEDASFDENYSRVCELYCRTSHLDNYELTNKAWLSNYEISEYLQDKNGCVTNGYAIYISDLEIFDKPKELSEFKHWVFYKKCEKCPYGKCDYDYGLCSQCCEIKPLTKAPQNFCYVEVE